MLQRWSSRISLTIASEGCCRLHKLVADERGAAALRAALASDAAAAREADADGWLPLHVAAYDASGSAYPDEVAQTVEVLQLLLKAHPEGAATPERSNGWLPLHLAAIHRSPLRVVRCLLRAFPAGAAARDAQGYTPAQHATIHGASPAVCSALCAGDSPAHRAVSLDALERFADEHDAWELPTIRVVLDIIAPATARSDGEPPARYASLLPAADVGLADVFVSHAWSAPFGLLVAAARAFAERSPAPRYRNELLRREREGTGPRPFPKPPGKVRFWVDIFAVAQHSSAHQADDLTWLSPLVRAAPLGTLLVAEAPAAAPLARAWCLYELAIVLHGPLTAGPLFEQSAGETSDLVEVRLTVMFGNLTMDAAAEGERPRHIFSAGDEAALAAAAERLDVTKAQATVSADLETVMLEINRVVDATAGRTGERATGAAAANVMLRQLLVRAKGDFLDEGNRESGPSAPLRTLDIGDNICLEIEGGGDLSSLMEMLAQAGIQAREAPAE